MVLNKVSIFHRQQKTSQIVQRSGNTKNLDTEQILCNYDDRANEEKVKEILDIDEVT